MSEILTNPVHLPVFVQGDDVRILVTLTDTVGGSPIDLTGATISSDIKKEYNTDVAASFTVENTDLPNGQFTLVLSAASSSSLPPKPGSRITSYVYDVKIVYQDGSINTPNYGYFKLQREVTV